MFSHLSAILNMRVFCVLFLMYVLGTSNYAEAQYARCTNPNQRAGLCMDVDECESLYTVLMRPNLQQSVKDFIRESRCNGGNRYNTRPFVCCTSDTDYARSRRLTPVYNDFNNGFQGDYGWESQPNVLVPTRSQSFFPSEPTGFGAPEQASNWGFNPMQAFGGDGGGFAGGSRSGGRRSGGNNLRRETNDGGMSGATLPQPPSCGGLTIQNKIYGGEDAELNEFPWMVLMEYRKRTGSISTNCAGTIINQRYVLTAAHCVTGRIEREIGPLVSVRLGEHDTTQQVDCDSRSCAPEALRLGIEEARAHDLYKEKSPNQVHDIALVRLERNVRFSESVRPVCLPSVMPQEQKRAGQQYTVAGWGRTLQSSRSPIKQKLSVSYVDPEQCKQKFSERKVSIVPTQLCAGGKYAQDSCDGDSGGPLMRYRNGGWVLEGIVSFGFKCGLKDWPGVYTSVAAYDDWIRRNMRP